MQAVRKERVQVKRFANNTSAVDGRSEQRFAERRSWSERRDSNLSGTTGQFPQKLALSRMNQRVAHDSHFDQHEAKPRFREEALSYGVIHSEWKTRLGFNQQSPLLRHHLARP
jgi:hypothetical protein